MTTLSALQAALNKEFQSPMSDLIARSNPLLSGLQKKSLATDRIWLRHKTGSSHNPRPIPDGSDVTVGTPASTYGAAVLDWSTYISEFAVPKRLLGQVQNNPEMIGMLFAEEIKDATSDLADKISADLFAGVTANGLVGLKSIMDTANSYAGVDRTTATYWQALVKDAAGADLSTSLFYDAAEVWFARNKNQLFSGANSPTIFTTQRLLRKFQELFETISYDALGASHFVNQANAGNQLGKAGVGFSGAPILPEPNINSTGDTAATDRMYILNPGAVFLASLAPNDDPEVVRMQQLDASKGQATDGLNVQIEILSNQGEMIKGYVKTYVQLVCDKPHAAGVLIKNVSNVL